MSDQGEHVVTVDESWSFVSSSPGPQTAQAVCKCGWKGPVRLFAEMAYTDTQDHYRKVAALDEGGSDE